MKLITRFSRGVLLTTGVALAIAVVALVPGGWGTARAQTAGSGGLVLQPAPPAPPPVPPAPPAVAPLEPFVPPVVAPAVAPPPPIAAPVVRDQLTTVALPVAVTAPGAPPAETAAMSLAIKPNTFAADVSLRFTPVATTQSNPAAATNRTAVTNALQALNVAPPPPPAPGRTSQVVNVFQMDAIAASGASVGGAAQQEMTVNVPVTPEVLALAGGNTANISLQFFNDTTKAWVKVPCSGGGGGLACQIPHLSLWALVVDAPEAAPQQVAPIPAKTGTGLWPVSSSATRPLLPLAIAVAGFGLIGGLGARALRRRG